MQDAVPVNLPSLSGNELTYLKECIESGWISSEGPFVSQFENGFSRYIGREHGISVANGSAALDIAVQALEIGPGDDVILPALTIISPALSIIRSGATPVLVDSDPVTWNMDVTQVEAAITPKTKAILVVHLYGLPIDMDPLLELSKKHNIPIIEDAAEMIGQTYRDKKCGNFGLVSTFSFYPNKHITTGEGGMVLCDDPEIADRCRKLRNLAFEPGMRRFVHYEMGWNYRMTNMQAALGMAQLEQIEKFLRQKREMGRYYQEHLAYLTDYNYQLPLHSTGYAENIYWIFGLVAPSEMEMNNLLDYLTKNRVGTRPFFWCMHEQPVFIRMGLFGNQHFPCAESLARRGFYIPGGLGITEKHMQMVTTRISDYFTFGNKEQGL